MRGKKILYAASSRRHIERFHLDYIRALRNLGNEVRVMANGADIDIRLEKKILSLENLKSLFRLKKILKRECFDCIILNTALAAFVVRAALGRRRGRVVYVVHGFLFDYPPRNARQRLLWLAEWLLRGRVDRVITMNSADLEIAKRLWPSGRVRQSRGMGCEVRGVITPAKIIREEIFGRGRFVLCFVGELSRRKNQRFLIQATAALRLQIPQILLCLVGDGGEMTELLSEARSLGVEDSVRLLGERDDACDFMRSCDVYVSASLSEGMPFNVIEALGAGATVLASDVKGHRDIITDGVDGFLYKSEDLDDFVNKTCQIYHKSIEIDKKYALEKYMKFSKSEVFETTLRLLTEEINE